MLSKEIKAQKAPMKIHESANGSVLSLKADIQSLIDAMMQRYQCDFRNWK